MVLGHERGRMEKKVLLVMYKIKVEGDKLST